MCSSQGLGSLPDLALRLSRCLVNTILFMKTQKAWSLGSRPTTLALKHQPALRLAPRKDRIKGTGFVLFKSDSSAALRSSLPIQTHRQVNRNLFSPGLPGTRLATLWLNPTGQFTSCQGEKKTGILHHTQPRPVPGCRCRRP